MGRYWGGRGEIGIREGEEEEEEETFGKVHIH